jgi:hypothetical protein
MPQTFVVKAVRPQDLLELVFEFVQVDFNPPAGSKPGEILGLKQSFLAVYFLPQHMAEEAVYESAGNYKLPPDQQWDPQPPGAPTPPPPGGMQAALAGPSRVVFTIPQGKKIPYTITGLLDAMQTLPLNVSPLMRWKPPGCNPLFIINPKTAPQPPKITFPARIVTAIEAPYRLILSPDEKGWWEHASSPITYQDRTELWHTRLNTTPQDADIEMRAIWSPDFDNQSLKPHNNEPFRMSLTGRDRNELVHLTANYYLSSLKGSYKPEPVDADQFYLSTLGAWMKVRGDWPVVDEIETPANNLMTVEQWVHQAAMARDQYVRVVYAGYLFPFGHRASLVKITERKFYYQQEPPGYVAYLFQRMYIIVRQRELSYSHRDVPFRKVTIKTKVTPNLDDPSLPASEVIQGVGQEAFWPRVTLASGESVDFPFHMVGNDWEGRPTEFTAPLIFVSLDIDKNQINQVMSHYGLSTEPNKSRRLSQIKGQAIAYAPWLKTGDTTLETEQISFGAIPKTGASQGPRFLPSMEFGRVDIPAITRMLNTPKLYEIAYEDSYKAAGGQTQIGNKGEVYVQLKDPVPLNFQVDKGGGLAAPDIKITALSRSLGPVDSTEYEYDSPGNSPVKTSVLDGGFVVEKIFEDVKLLGGIPLGFIINNVADFGHAFSAGKNIPSLKSVVEKVNGVDTLRTTYMWSTSGNGLRNYELFKPNGSVFSIESIMETPLNGSEPSFRLEGKLTDFTVNLLPSVELVALHFRSLSFTAVNGQKPDLSVDLKDFEFKGILAFVNRLLEVIPLDGFSDPPDLAISAEGIKLGFSLGIPTVGVGIFSMQNISLSAGVFLPLLTGKKLNFHFAFCERQQPFILTVSLFGGGGFFGIDIGIDGVTMVEAALEFGASAAINLGVAKGSASIMGGFYFQKAGAGFELTGYFRAAGSLSVLGIISVSLEFYLALTYTSKGAGGAYAGAMWGQASLTVKIEILFFSTSVSVKMERQFAGSDPTFHQLVAPTDWAAYCAAFADY